MKLYTVVVHVYNLIMCVKEDNLGLNYFKGVTIHVTLVK